MISESRRGPEVDAKSSRSPTSGLPKHRRLVFVSLYALYLAAVAWFGLKLYWKFTYDVPLTRSLTEDDIWRHYYPELWRSSAVEAEIAADDGRYDVLLLGASVLEQVAGSLESELRETLGERLRVYSLAKAAHTSRDSFLKFSRLGDKPFDLIVVYHAINDARMNCCPGVGLPRRLHALRVVRGIRAAADGRNDLARRGRRRPFRHGDSAGRA